MISGGYALATSSRGFHGLAEKNNWGAARVNKGTLGLRVEESRSRLVVPMGALTVRGGRIEDALLTFGLYKNKDAHTR